MTVKTVNTPMNAAERIIEKMPEKFTRKMVLQCAKELGYSYSTANAVLDRMLYEDLAERIETGLYRKLETEVEEPEEPEDEEFYEDDWEEEDWEEEEWEEDFEFEE